MMPKINVRPMPSSAYVPPSTMAFKRCWSNSFIAQRPSGRLDRPQRETGFSVPARRIRRATGYAEARRTRCSDLRQDDFARFDLDQIDVRDALPAFHASRPSLVELDPAIEAVDLDLPERGADRLRVGFSGLLDRRRNGADPVVAAETLRHAGKRQPALLPLGEEILRCRGRGCRFRHPGGE